MEAAGSKIDMVIDKKKLASLIYRDNIVNNFDKRNSLLLYSKAKFMIGWFQGYSGTKFQSG